MADVSRLFKTLEARAQQSDAGALGVAVLGGTFDPVHNGHVQVAHAVLARVPLAGLIVMPALVSNFKRDQLSAPAQDRLAMCELAFSAIPGCFVSDMEMRRGGVSYTADTLSRIARSLPPGVSLSFVVGTDSLASLSTWHNAALIARTAQIICVARAGEDLHEAMDSVQSSGLGFRVHLIQDSIADVSSTAVRAALRAGKRIDEMVPPSVLSYIQKHHLYSEGM